MDARLGRGTPCPDGTVARRAGLVTRAAAAIAVTAVLLETGAALLMWAGLGYGQLPLSMVSGPSAVVGGVALVVACAAMGGLLATRRPCSLVGWLFVLAALTEATTLLATMLVAEAHQVMRPVPDTTLLLAWLTSSWTLPSLLTLLALVLVVFPDGRSLSRRWSVAAAVTAAGSFLGGVGSAVDARGLSWFPSLPNPFGASPLVGLTPELHTLGFALGAGGLVLGVAAAIARYRGGDATLRAQLRWIVLAGLLLAASLISFLVIRYELPQPALADVLVTMAFAAGAFVPVAAAIAILRHHLYGMQVLVDRTLVYLPLMALSGGLYAASVALFQRLFVAFTGDTSDGAVIVSALILASVFTPLRRVLETHVERHFHLPTSKPDGATAAPAVETGRGPDGSTTGVPVQPAWSTAGVPVEPTADRHRGGEADEMAARLERLEDRLRRLEAERAATPSTPGPGPAPGPAGERRPAVPPRARRRGRPARPELRPTRP